jgi:hypothetical protein
VKQLENQYERLRNSEHMLGRNALRNELRVRNAFINTRSRMEKTTASRGLSNG